MLYLLLISLFSISTPVYSQTEPNLTEKSIQNKLVIKQENSVSDDSQNLKIEIVDKEPAQAEPEQDKPADRSAISESFSTENSENQAKTDLLDTLSEDVSWFFQKKETKHKIAIVPIYSHNKTQGSRLGARFFSFSPEADGYYLSFSGAKYLSNNYYSSIISYKSHRKNNFRSELKVIYDNHYENYYGSLESYQGMQAKLSEITKINSQRLMMDYNLFYQKQGLDYYLGAGVRLFIRKADQEHTSHFPSEYFVFLKSFGGFDNRDNWKYPTKGAFHQIHLGCSASLVFPAHCQAQGDFRFYISPFKDLSLNNLGLPYLTNSILSLRLFYGSSFFVESSYSTKYSLTGESFFHNLAGLRGFKYRRFLGDKIYFMQSEAKIPIWKEYLIGAVFFELGETTQLKEAFSGFVHNYGGGLRIGWPNDSGMKIRIDYSAGKDFQKITNHDFIISFLQAF